MCKDKFNFRVVILIGNKIVIEKNFVFMIMRLREIIFFNFKI